MPDTLLLIESDHDRVGIPSLGYFSPLTYLEGYHWLQKHWMDYWLWASLLVSLTPPVSSLPFELSPVASKGMNKRCISVSK